MRMNVRIPVRAAGDEGMDFYDDVQGMDSYDLEMDLYDGVLEMEVAGGPGGGG